MKTKYTIEDFDRIADEIRSRISLDPQIGLILGSGLGSFVQSVEGTDIPYGNIRGFPVPTVEDTLAVFWLLLAIIFVYLVFPFYWAITSSLKTEAELIQTPTTFWPHNLSLDNYVAIFRNERFIQGLVNSAIVFGIFVTGGGTIAPDPANNRIFVRFSDAVERGSTSVAVQTQ